MFAGLEDLDDKAAAKRVVVDDLHAPSGEDPSAGESSDEGPITEEFDVGPEFIRRQRAEEEKWRKKVDKWVGIGDRDTDWRWAIRGLVADGNAG